VQRCPDISLARAKLGWEPKMKLDAGLKRTIAYFDQTLRHSGEKLPATIARSKARARK
jgi:UDP-glucuronate decarboxylase